MATLATTLRPATWRRVRPWRPTRGDVMAWAALAAGIVLVTWSITRVLPARVVAETLAAGEAVNVGAGRRDRACFDREWRPPVTDGNATIRVSAASTARLRVPLPIVQPYDATVRLDPLPLGSNDSHGTLQVFLNQQLVGTQPVRRDPARIGTYHFHIPETLTRKGTNEFVFTLVVPEHPATRIRFWYLRLRPPGA